MSWIDIKDRLPEFGVAVLTIGKNDRDEWTTALTAQIYKDGDTLRFISGFSFVGDRLIRTMVETKPTHWQPLPEPPKGKEDE